MTTNAAADELKCTITKKSGVAVTNWSCDDDSAPGALDATLVRSPLALKSTKAKLLDEGIGGETPQSDTVNGEVSTEFEIEQDLRYEDSAGHLPTAMFFGASAGTPSTPGGTNPRAQAFTLEPNLNGVVATVCEGPTTSHATAHPSVGVCPSAMVNSWELSGSGAGIISVKTGWRGIDVFRDPAPTLDPRDTDITINATRAAVAAATLASTSQRVKMGDCQLYVDTADGATDFNGSGGQVYAIVVTDFTLSAERDLSYDYGSQAANAPDQVSRIQMPVNGSQHVMPKMTFNISRWTADTWLGYYQANTALRVRLEFIGDEIESGYSRRWRFDMPECKVSDRSLDSGGRIQDVISLDCFAAASAPTGFNSTHALRADVQNELTTDIMA